MPVVTCRPSPIAYPSLNRQKYHTVYCSKTLIAQPIIHPPPPPRLLLRSMRRAPPGPTHARVLNLQHSIK